MFSGVHKHHGPLGEPQEGQPHGPHHVHFPSTVPKQILYFFGIIEVNYDTLECSKIYTNIMDPQANLKKDNPMDPSTFILQVMYYISCYIFEIIDVNYDKIDFLEYPNIMDPQKFPTKGKPHSY